MRFGPFLNEVPTVIPEPNLRLRASRHDHEPVVHKFRLCTGRFTAKLASPVWVDEGEDLANRFLEHISGHATNTPRLSHAPVQALDLI